MPMERSVSCATERTAGYAGGATDLRSYSASYAPRKAMNRGRSTTSPLSRRPMQRSGSVRSVAAAGPTPGLNLRCYSASYAASYGPTQAADAGSTAAAAGPGGQLKRSGSVTNWSSSSAGRRSVNLRGYTPSFSAIESTAAVAPYPPAHKKTASGGGVLDEAEMQRKKRLVTYKAYGVEGRVRDTVRRGVGWIKSRCARVAYGWW